MLEVDKYTLPECWACALINGDVSGLEDLDCYQLDKFVADVVARRGSCNCVSVSDESGGDFRAFHDATRYGVLACNVAEFSFLYEAEAAPE